MLLRRRRSSIGILLLRVACIWISFLRRTRSKGISDFDSSGRIKRNLEVCEIGGFLISEKKEVPKKEKKISVSKSKKKLRKKGGFEKSKEKKKYDFQFSSSKRIKNFLRKKEILMAEKFTLKKSVNLSRQNSLKKLKKNENLFDRNTLKSSRSRLMSSKIKFENVGKNSKDKKDKKNLSFKLKKKIKVNIKKSMDFI